MKKSYLCNCVVNCTRKCLYRLRLIALYLQISDPQTYTKLLLSTFCNKSHFQWTLKGFHKINKEISHKIHRNFTIGFNVEREKKKIKLSSLFKPWSFVPSLLQFYSNCCTLASHSSCSVMTLKALLKEKQNCLILWFFSGQTFQ